jgi:hypothetical protein
MDLAILEQEYVATLGSVARARPLMLIDDTSALSPDAPILSGWEHASSVAPVSVRGLLDGASQAAPASPRATKIGLNLNITAPLDDEDALVKDVVASPVFHAPLSPELHSKKFALPADAAGFTQWAPSL